MGNRTDLRGDTSTSIEITGAEDVKLTAMQQIFAEAYFANGCRNAADAMRRAGYRGTNAYVAAACMLKKPNVVKYIQLRKEHLLNEAGINAYNVLIEIASIAFADARQLYNADGTIKKISQLPKTIAAAIESIESEEIIDFSTGKVIGHTKKVKLNNKLKALELLMKYTGLLDPADNNINLNNFNVTLDLGNGTPKLNISSND